MSNETLADRKATLERISGLTVTIRTEKNQRVFSFARPETPHLHVKEAWTYPKAKCFAEGVRVGRDLGAMQGMNKAIAIAEHLRDNPDIAEAAARAHGLQPPEDTGAIRTRIEWGDQS